MRKVEIKMTKRQWNKLTEFTGYPNPPHQFALISSPILSSGVMKILVLNTSEFNKCNKFMKRFIPKELRNPK